MNTTSDLFESFLACPTKCFLRAHAEVGSGNEYADWVKSQNSIYRNHALKRLQDGLPQGACLIEPPSVKELESNGWVLAVNVLAQTENVVTQVQAVERVPSASPGKPAQFIPIRFVCFNKLTKEDRLLLAFDAFVLSTETGQDVNLGKIIHGDDHATLKVKMPNLFGETRKLFGKTAALLAVDSPPDLILNRHCGECEFRDRCRQKAVEKDDLSLLSGITAKLRKKYHAKGIFTTTQLSYIFRPRRRPKNFRNKHEKYQQSLKALAIREKKIHVFGSPEFKIEGTPVFLDVEGLPDRDFYYLIGLRVRTGESYLQHCLWADNLMDERKIWKHFLALIDEIPNPTLIHYGSYEKAFLKRMKKRYGGLAKGSETAKAKMSSVNILSIIYARVYFPTYSNRLKDIAALLGAEWEFSNASGLQAIAWRQSWESSGDSKLKERLLAYNRDDCEALNKLTTELLQVLANPRARSDVDLANEPKAPATERSAEIHHDLKQVLQSAYSDYHKARIRLSGTSATPRPVATHVNRSQRGSTRRLPPVKGRIVRVPRKRKCQSHLDHPTLLKPQRTLREHALIDIAFTRYGCKKTVVRYVGKNSRCPYCHHTFPAPGVKRVRNQLYDTGFKVWVSYLRIVLRLSYRQISKATNDLFHEPITTQAAELSIQRMSEKYRLAENRLLSRIFSSAAIHVDETQLSILGVQQYVWVLTDGQHAVFRLTEGRETDFLQPLFANYSGTLITDFYGGYDALPCRQQKCLVHLIRDLNDDLWKNPFNVVLEDFVAAVRDLLLFILGDVQRFGLKAYHLEKHRVRVKAFYKRLIDVEHSDQELIAKYQKRFARFRKSLFTFLEYDNVPWNNNAAERALRHLAVQRKISGAFTQKGADDYLRLLGIAQSCRFQDKSFLGFLLSECMDVDEYRDIRKRKVSAAADLKTD